jgi:hypothetical protein
MRLLGHPEGADEGKIVVIKKMVKFNNNFVH